MSSNDLLAPGGAGHHDPEALDNDLLAPGRVNEFSDQPGAPASHVAPSSGVGDMPEGFMHPNEGDDEPFARGDLNSPFSPHSPQFALGLTEEDVVEARSPVPGVQARKPSILLSHEEREAALQALLANEMEANADSDGPIILEFGPLAGLEKRLRNIAVDHVDADVAAVVMAKVRRCIHEVVIANPMLSEKERTEDGLMARIAAVGDLTISFTDQVEPVIDRIESSGLDLSSLRRVMRGALDSEGLRLNAKTKSLVPATVGTHIFDGLVDLKDNIVSRLTGKEELVGDVRRHRNEQLSRQLSSLVDVAHELRANSGDEEWERAEGAMALNAADELTNSIHDLTRGVEDQVDFSVLNKGFGDARRNMQDAAEAAATEEHRERIKKMVELIKNAVEAIANAIKRALGHDPNAAKPAAMAP